MDEIFFDMFLTFNDVKTEAYINIRPNSRIDKKNLKKSLQEAYKKVKLSLKLSDITYGIINDKEIMEKLKEYILMPEDERKKDIYTFILAKGKEPVDGKDSKLIIHIDLNKKKTGKVDPKTGQINHKDLGFSERIVPKDTKIATIIKPTKGEHGIKVDGEVIQPIPGKLIHSIKFDKKSIYLRENEDEINFYTSKEGFLYQDNIKGFFVDSNILVKSVDYSIGNIDADDVDNTSVIVRGKADVTEDSIKPGFKVEAKNINITGNVGIEAEIIGENITINGITDKNSKLTGKKIKIKKAFNNFIKGESIEINEVNGANITGEYVFVKNSISGNINCSELIISNEARGSSFVIEKFLLIKSSIGSAKQIITIDSLFSNKRKELYDKLKLERNKIKKNFETIYEKYELEKDKHNKLELLIDELIEKSFKIKDKNKIFAIKKIFLSNNNYEELFKKYNIELTLHDESKISKFCNLKRKLLSLESAYNQTKKEFDEINEKINQIENSHFETKIIFLKSESPIVIHFSGRVFTYNERFTEPIKISFKRAAPKFDQFSIKELKNYQDFLSQETFDYLKKLFRF